MKLPLLITYLKLIEHQPYLLEEEVVYEKSPELNSDNQNFKPANPLVVGETYSVQELLEHAVINSDNDAAAMLAAHLGDAQYRNTLVELGVYIPLGVDTVDFITAKTYANIFRILYNASYLSRESSEFALDLMSRSQFKGIAEPLPPSTVVSHKFGELELTENNNVYLFQLHDCGIVYKESRPYTLCIMTQGKNFDDLYSVLKDFSTIVYNAM
jgi:hypothetical protein